MQRTRAIVWMVVASRWVFAALVFGLVALIAMIAGPQDPLAAAGAWWMVSGTLVDVLCLAVLIVATRREGIRVADLVVLDRRHVLRDVLLGFGLIFALIPALVINQALTAVFYPGQLPPQIGVVHLPLWATVYSIAIWPIIWSFTEQSVYQGYAFPRLQAMTRSRIAAGAVVVAFWSLQHTALPFVPDARYLVYRTITVIPVAITAVLLYLFVTRRRLLPLMIVHWFADVLAALSPVLLAQAA